MKDTVLIYSGGLDSSSALYIYQESIDLAISFNYGSRHNEQEIKRAITNCEKLNIKHKIIDLQMVFSGITSALLGSSSIPHGHYEDKTMKDTVVPFRNGVMLSIATMIAEDRNYKKLMLGSHKGDNAIYPDCRPEFNIGMAKAIKEGTYNRIELFAPFENLTKKELATLGIKAGLNPDDTYSCYEGGDEECGKCSTCREKLWALGLRKEP